MSVSLRQGDSISLRTGKVTRATKRSTNRPLLSLARNDMRALAAQFGPKEYVR